MDTQQVRQLVAELPVDRLFPHLGSEQAARLCRSLDSGEDMLCTREACDQFLRSSRDAVIALELLKTRLTWLTGYAYKQLSTLDPALASRHGSPWQMAPAVEMCEQIGFGESLTLEGWHKSRLIPAS